MNVRLIKTERRLLSKEEYTEYKTTSNKIAKATKDSIDLCINIINGKCVEFEATEDKIEGWDEVVTKVVNTMEDLDSENLYNKSIENISSNKVKQEFLKNKSENVKAMEKIQCHFINEEISKNYIVEENEIKKDITKNTIINMTGRNHLKKNVNECLKLGAKFIPYLKMDKDEIKKQVMNGVTDILNTTYGENKAKYGNFKSNSLKPDILYFLGNPELRDEDQEFLSKILEGLDVTIEDCWSCNRTEKGLKEEKYYKKLFDLKEEVIIESDKNVGYGLYTLDQVLQLYSKTNQEQGFSKIEITNEEYVKIISKHKIELLPEIPIWIKNKLTQKEIDNFKKNTGEIGFLRILPKMHKIKNPSFEKFSELTCRTIKATNSDPINGIAAIVCKVSKPIVKALIEFIKAEFGFQPSVGGGDEAFYLISNYDVEMVWNKTLNAQGDIVNLYPMLDYPYVKEAYRKALKIVEIEKASCQFIQSALFILMKNNYFRQPDGHYKTGNKDAKIDRNGFAIGCLTAAEASNLTLLVHEIEILTKLRNENLLKVIAIYMRFMDDLKIVLKGEKADILKTLSIISKGYPPCLTMKIKVSFFINNFLDMKTYILPPSSRIKIMLLRKKNNVYDITRKYSNTTEQIKYSAMYAYAYRMHRRTNQVKDYKQQKKINLMIFHHRGFDNKEFIGKIKKTKLRIKMMEKRKQLEKRVENKRYGGKITFDKVSNSHQHILDLVKKSNPPKDLYLPIIVPGKNLKRFIYTKRKFENKIKAHYERKY